MEGGMHEGDMGGEMMVGEETEVEGALKAKIQVEV